MHQMPTHRGSSKGIDGATATAAPPVSGRLECIQIEAQTWPTLEARKAPGANSTLTQVQGIGHERARLQQAEPQSIEGPKRTTLAQPLVT